MALTKSEQINSLNLARLRDYFLAPGNKKSWLYLLGITVTVVGIVSLLYYISLLIPDFMALLMAKDMWGFFTVFGQFLGVALGLACVTQIKNFLINRLALNWQVWLIKIFMGGYSKDQCYHYIAEKKGIDNVDQRLEQDFEYLTVSTLNLTFGGLTSAVD